MNEQRVPLLFVDGARIGVMDGTGESVQVTFSSTIGLPDGSMEEVIAVRVAMTKLAFMGLAETCNQVASDINASADAEAASKRQAN